MFFLKPIIKEVWRKAAAVVANSQGLKQLALETDPERKIDIICNGIGTAQFRPGSGGRDKIRILCVSRLIERKGISHLIESVPLIKEKHGNNFEILIVGEGNLEQELRSLSSSLGADDVVSFAGYIEHSRLPEIYASSDIFVLPSLNEGMSNTILEAMACGLPIITTDTGGTSELISDNGIVLRDVSSVSIADAVCRLIADNEVRRAMGNKSREIAEGMGWGKVAERYLDIYETFLQRGAGIKILMLNYEFPPLGGGAATVTYNLAKELVRQGHEVDVVTMHYKGLNKVEDLDGIRIYRVRCLRKKQEVCYTIEMLTYVISAFLFTLKLTRKKNYDIVHCHFIIPTGMVGYLLQKFRGLPYITTSHGSDIRGYNPERFKLQHKLIKPIWKLVARNALRVTAVSNYLKNLILENADLGNISLIYNGQEVDNQVVEKTEKSILLLSRILERKGFQYFLYAIKDFDLKDWEINIVGDGPYLGELKRIAVEFNLPVKFLGYKKGKELEEIYRRSSIFVFPSAREAFPVVLLEALSYGCAIITTDIESCKEVVGDSALFVRPECPDDIKEALRELINSPQLRSELSIKARDRVKQFSWDRIGEEYLTAYKAAIMDYCKY